jgi:predicted esterase
MMKLGSKTIAMLAMSLFASWVVAQAPASQPIRGPRGGETRVQDRTYPFTDTNEDMPYAVFVSSKVSKDKPAPLILALRGANGNPRSLLIPSALNLAEEGGYIMVGVMGYNSTGYFGMPTSGRGGAPGGRTGAPGRAGASSQPATQPARGAPGGRAGGAPARAGAGGSAVNDAAKASELSEKDVMNVFEMIKKEYKIDEKRMYLLGHSQGGGGVLFLGEKYASNWAGVVAMSPGLYGAGLPGDSKIKDVPFMIMVGASDGFIESVHNMEAHLKEVKLPHDYKEYPNVDHGGIINAGMADAFKYFAEHVKK